MPLWVSRVIHKPLHSLVLPLRASRRNILVNGVRISLPWWRRPSSLYRVRQCNGSGNVLAVRPPAFQSPCYRVRQCNTIREVKNIVVQSGLEALAALVVGEIPQGNAIFLALGTGTTVADHADTILEEEGYRKIIASRSRFSSEIRFRFFFTVSEGNGDWSEAGVFLAGTEMPDTGHLLNRVLPPGGVSKADNQTLTVEVRISLYAA